MTTYFVSGHLDLTVDEFREHYAPRIAAALSNDPDSAFVVGDARGCDIMAQMYLRDARALRVQVFHRLEAPRNNVNGYPTIGGFATDGDRDSAMTAASDKDSRTDSVVRTTDGTSCQNEHREHASRTAAMDKKKKKPKKLDPAQLVTIPMGDLLLAHKEIGIHRGRKHGFRDVFGFKTLQDQPFTKLASKVKDAYEGKNVPPHQGWPAQRDVLRWFVDKGADALYQLKDDILVYRHPDGRRYQLAGGNHRSLALYILGADSIRAAVTTKPTRTPAVRVGSRSMTFNR